MLMNSMAKSSMTDERLFTRSEKKLKKSAAGMETRRTLPSDFTERVHDAPDRSEEADEGRHAGRAREETETLLEPGLFDGGGAGERAGHGVEAPDRGTRGGGASGGGPDLLVDLLVAGLEHADEGGVGELVRDRVHFRELLALAEHVQESLRLARCARQHRPLVDDDSEGDAGEDQKQEKDGDRRRSGVLQEAEGASAEGVLGGSLGQQERDHHLYGVVSLSGSHNI
jgi:hypothetical protein